MPQPMASRNNRLSVVDVYDIAASIGKEFEKIIDHNGPDAVADLMPKVINVLEHLEELTTRDQDEEGELEDLKFTVERLQTEKSAKAEEREKYEKELEQIEETWQAESDDLMKSVTRLQEENRRLKGALKDKEGQDAQQTIFVTEESLEDCTLVRELREKLHTQRNRLRSVERELGQKNLDFDAMQGQVDRMCRLNAEMRHKTSLTNQRAQNLIQEQVDLEAQLHDKDQEIVKIREKIKDQDLGSPPVRLSPFVFEAQLSDSNQSKLPSKPSATTPTSPTMSPDDMTMVQDKLERQGKVVYDAADPNRPRFTLNELRDILQERNELKTKLIDVEQELEQYKPADAEAPQSPVDIDAPVHGPINREPDEKLFPDRFSKGKSGIRKFFAGLLSPSASNSRHGSPRNTKRRSSLVQTSQSLQTTRRTNHR